MKKLKLTDVQKHRLNSAYREASEVLREIKQQSLEGTALHDMKNLEEATIFMEAVILSTR